MTDRDRLAADLLEGIEQAWHDDLLYGGNAEALDPSGWTRSTFPEAANRLADRLIALGWTRLGEERLARARDLVANYLWNEDDSGDDDQLQRAYDEMAAVLGPSTEESVGDTLAKAYREATDATD